MSWLTEPDADWDAPVEPPRGRLKLLAVLFAGWLAVSLIVLFGLLTFSGHSSSPKSIGTSAADTAAATAPSTSPTAGSPAGWVEQASDDQTNCVAHSYGQVQIFFAKTACSSLHRTLSTTEQGGRSVVIAESVVTFDTEAKAARYLVLVTADGTGNISDLLREGTRYPGSPSKLPTAAFASRRDGTRVLVAEAAYVEGASGPQDPRLQAVANRVVGAS